MFNTQNWQTPLKNCYFIHLWPLQNVFLNKNKIKKIRWVRQVLLFMQWIKSLRIDVICYFICGIFYHIKCQYNLIQFERLKTLTRMFMLAAGGCSPLVSLPIATWFLRSLCKSRINCLSSSDNCITLKSGPHCSCGPHFWKSKQFTESLRLSKLYLNVSVTHCMGKSRNNIIAR